MSLLATLTGSAVFPSAVSVGAEGFKRALKAWTPTLVEYLPEEGLSSVVKSWAPSLVEYLPDSKPFLKTGIWGAVFGVTGEGVRAGIKSETVPKALAAYSFAAATTSQFMSRVFGGTFEKWMEQSMPFVVLYGGYAAAYQAHRLFYAARPVAYLRLPY